MTMNGELVSAAAVAGSRDGSGMGVVVSEFRKGEAGCAVGGSSSGARPPLSPGILRRSR